MAAMSGDNNDSLVEIYLASIWQYHDAGVKRVLDALRKKQPGAQCSFEEESAFFKVSCKAGDVLSVQNIFREVHSDIERGLNPKKIPSDNEWIKPPSPGNLPKEPASKTVIDQLCPVAFDRFAFRKVWTRVKTDTPDSVSAHKLLGEDDRKSIMANTDAHIAVDTVSSRLIYIGAETKAAVAKASKMLDNLFNRFVFVMPPPKHLLYAETDSAYHVDARYMAHVNDTMLTSTIFDPSQYPTEALLEKMYSSAFAKGVCLRICEVDHFKRIEVSLFGPRSPPMFNDQVRKWPLWFKRAEYTPKIPGVTAPKKAQDPAPAPVKGPVVKLIESKPETNLIEAKPAGDKQANAGDLAVKGKCENKPQDGPVTPKANSETVKLIDIFDDSPAQPTMAVPPSAPAPAPQTSAVVASSAPAAPLEQDNMLIQIDNSPPRPVSPPLPQDIKPASAAQEKGKGHSVAPSLHARVSKALVRRSTFTSNLCSAIGRLMSDLPYSKGRIRLQVELGRVYIMDANPEGLAFNMPGEAAAGWPQSEITTRLDTICVSPESIVFSRALTLFANDLESVLGLNANATAQGLLTNVPSSILDGDDSDGQKTSRPEWSFHEKRIVYEFKCQRLYLKSNGVIKATSPFVVEVDGTEPGAFTYAIRSVEDTRPPIWIHCIRRHWDARVSVSYSQTDKLEAEYGDFVRELLRSMVVPPGPITSPRFHFSYDHREAKKDSQSYSTMVLSARIRNVGRFVSADQQSFLDVSWNWLMALAKRPSKDSASAGTIYATPAPDNPTRGMFTSWYEASVVSAEAEAAFRENETLVPGEMAAWGGIGATALDEMYESAFHPALRLVQKMDGVGVLVDNGQGERQWMPPMKASQVALAVQKFW
ncbi:MAG: hypothetical protein STHCBS139747_007684 [Sporothrix thermara]